MRRFVLVVLVVRVALGVVVGGAAGCPFASTVPHGAVLLCAADVDCPAGDACDREHHVCAAPGADTTPPLLTSALFTPSALGDGTAALAVDANEALSTTSPPAVSFADGVPALPVAGVVVNSAHAEITFRIDGTVADGTYRVATISLTDVNGNSAERDSEAFVVVDRQAPILRDFSVEDADPGDGALVYADIAPHNVLTATVLASEPLATVALSVGALSTSDGAGTCTADANVAYRYACTLDLSASVDGRQAAALDASDDAGNATRVTLDVDVDAAAPALVAGAASLAITSPSGSSIAAPGGTVRITGVATEPLGAAPTAILDVPGAPVPFTATFAGQVFTLTLDVDDENAPPDGSYGVLVDLTDPVGHTALALPLDLAGGVAFGRGVVSACPVPPSFASCIDFDGDGFFARGPGCENGADCNDLDPSVFTGAPEIAGDGLDNDCAGDGDEPIDDTHGVFVNADPSAGDDGRDGNAGSPLLTFEAARARAHAQGKHVVYLAAGGNYVVNAPIDIHVVGGLNPAAFGQRTSAPSVLTSGSTIVIEPGVYLDGVATPAGVSLDVNGDGVFIARSDLDGGVNINRTAFLVDSRGGGVSAQQPLGELRIIGGTLRSLLVSEAVVVVVRTTISAGDGSDTAIDAAGGNTRLTLVDVAANRGLQIHSGAKASIFHSSIHVTSGLLSDLAPPIVLTGADALIAGSSLLSTSPSGDTVLVVAGNSTLALTSSNLFSVSQGPALTADSVVFSPNDCSFPGCVVADRNISEDPGLLFGDAFHLSPQSALRNADVDPAGMPTAVVGDIDGDCRYRDGHDDIGADEAP